MKEKNDLFTIEKGCCPYYQDLVNKKMLGSPPPRGECPKLELKMFDFD